VKRLERLQAIILYLQSKKTATGADIADHFNVSVRTVIRDMRSLEEAGVPIGAEAGLGYFLCDSYRLPPVMFTSEEATALLIGGKLTEQLSDRKTKEAHQSALMKIISVLKGDEKEDIETLHTHISVIDSLDKDASAQDFLRPIQQAIVQKQQIEIEYYSLYKDSTNTRTVEPIGLTMYGGNWHMIAYCILRQDYRDFRIDRIQSLHTLASQFQIKKHIALDDYFDKYQSNEQLYEIVLLGRKEGLRFIKDSKYWYGFTHQEEHSEEYMRLFFRNADLNGFAKWVMMGGKNVIVEKPEKLKDVIKARVKELADHYLQ